MNKFTKALKLQQLIESNTKLKTLELDGFVNGVEKGKTMNRNHINIIATITKQYDDFMISCTKQGNPLNDDTLVLKALADLRNVAGLMFLFIENPKVFDMEET
jgi:hypothetical protein